MKRKTNIFLMGLFSVFFLSVVSCSDDKWDKYYDDSVDPNTELGLNTQKAIQGAGYAKFSQALNEYKLLKPADNGVKATFMAVPDAIVTKITTGRSKEEVRAILNNLIFIGELPFENLVEGKIYKTIGGLELRYILERPVLDSGEEGEEGEEQTTPEGESLGFFQNMLKPLEVVEIIKTSKTISNGLVYEVSGYFDVLPSTLLSLKEQAPDFYTFSERFVVADSSRVQTYPSINSDGVFYMHKYYPGQRITTGGKTQYLVNTVFLYPPDVQQYADAQRSYLEGSTDEEINSIVVDALPTEFTLNHVAALDSLSAVRMSNLQEGETIDVKTMSGATYTLEAPENAIAFDNGNYLYGIESVMLKELIYSSPKNPIYNFKSKAKNGSAVEEISSGIKSVGDWENFCWTNTNRRGDNDFDVAPGDYVKWTFTPDAGALYANAEYDVYFYYRAKTDRYGTTVVKLYINGELYADDVNMGDTSSPEIGSSNPGLDGLNTPEPLRWVKLPQPYMISNYVTPAEIEFKIEIKSVTTLIHEEFMCPRCVEFRVKPKE